MDRSTLLSIIVPVYNVEQYLRKCIESILSQKYTDFELILIDDGSIDNSGKICDEYAAKDKRIVLIHKENEGVSIARNLGLNLAKGKYITFVDSDDEYYTDELLSDNMSILLKNRDIDIIQFPFITSDNIGNETSSFTGYIRGRENIFRSLFEYEYINGYPWNKIYKSYIFKDLRFPEGQRFEDIYLLYDILDNINCIFCSNKGFYKYLLRNDSFTNLDYSIEKYKDEFKYLTKGLRLVLEYKNIVKGRVSIYKYFFHQLICAQKKYGMNCFYEEIDFFQNIRLSKRDISYMLRSTKSIKEKVSFFLLFVCGYKLYLRVLKNVNKVL